MGKPKIVMLKTCKHCGSILRVESCGTYCPNYKNNNPKVWMVKKGERLNPHGVGSVTN